MNNILPLYLRTGKQNHQKGLSVLAHEIFHCLTRCNKDFRKEMYDLINFSIADKEYDIEDDIKRITISNPDVEHHDAFATFTINGEKKDCYMLNICTKPFENKGDQLIIKSPFIYDRVHDDSLLTTNTLHKIRPYGINSLTDTFKIEKLHNDVMILKGNMLRLYFDKY